MNQATTRNCVEALRAWLRDDLGDGANVHPQGDIEHGTAGNLTVRFSISVRDSEATDLLMMGKKQGRIIHSGYALRITKVDAQGHVEASGRYARRDFVVHFRMVAR